MTLAEGDYGPDGVWQGGTGLTYGPLTTWDDQKQGWNQPIEWQMEFQSDWRGLVTSINWENSVIMEIGWWANTVSTMTVLNQKASCDAWTWTDDSDTAWSLKTKTFSCTKDSDCDSDQFCAV